MALEMKWTDIKPKLEEEEMKKSKKAKLEEQQPDKEEKEEDEEDGDGNNEDNEGQNNASDNEYEPIGLAELLVELWNEAIVPKGADAVSEQQKAFLNKHTERVEAKYLKDRAKMMPEIESGLAHIVVYLPKYLKYRREHTEKK